MNAIDFAEMTGLSDDKSKLLSYLLEEEGVELLQPQTIVARADVDDRPLSFAQQRLWVLDQLAPGTAAYTISFGVRLRGALDVRALHASLSEIARRHEVLRTTIQTIDGQPRQALAPAQPLALPLADLRGLGADEQAVEVRRRTAEEARRPFDLARGPLLRALLLRLAADEHLAIVTLHHIVADGWSMGVLLNEIAALYPAFAAGRRSPLPELPIQYADYAHWQRGWLRGALLDEQLGYWRRTLADLPTLQLPTDRPRPPIQTFAGATHAFLLPAELADQLRQVSQREGATLFMTLLAAFQALIARYSGQDDIPIGSPIANRTQGEIEGLIGLFANTLVLRGDLSDDPSFAALLSRTREACLGAYAHQDVPFEQVVEALQASRDLSRSPLFQVMFVLQNTPMPEVALPGLLMSHEEAATATAKFDLTLTMVESARGLEASFEYNTDLFEADTIARLAGHLRTLLAGVAADAEQPISRLPLLTEAERAQLLGERAEPALGAQQPAAHGCLHELFAAQAARTPDAVALVFEPTNDQRPTTNDERAAPSLQSLVPSPRQVTYQELDRRANQVAHYLQRLGVGPGALVGVCVDRSIELLVGLLGVLKAGAAYLPLDPTHPPERLAFMLEDAGAAVLVTTSDQRPSTNDEQPTTDHRRPTTDERPGALSPCQLVTLSPSQGTVVNLARDWPAIARQPVNAPDVPMALDSPACVIYTSGSTGQPKGVLVSHRNIARLFASSAHWFRFGPDDVWTLFHTYAFDFSIWEIWGALLHGGRLVVVPYLVSRAPDAFYNLLAAAHVTVLNQTPSAFHQITAIAAAPGAAHKLALRYVIFGGEALEFQRLRPWFERFGDQRPRLVNMYGITETTVHVTYRPLTSADLESPGSAIGGPIPDLRLYILDRHMQPVPIGVPGELYVGGAGLTHGYLNRAELTAERFVPNPFETMNDERRTMNEQPDTSSFIVHRSSFGTRLYKSGDLARWLPGGDIEYLGRADQQVKLRGFRIELGEIAAALGRHPAVRDAVVLAREDRPGEKRLVAYVIPTNDQRPTTNDEPPDSLVVGRSSFVAELRAFLAEWLPEYMVPSAFVVLDALPLTSNGKVDRRALPAPDTARPELDGQYVAPRTPAEKTIAGIWTQVLGLERVGIHDNFFALGGNSLLIVQLHSRLRDALGRNIAMVELFRYPTVRSFARYVEQEQGGASALQQGHSRASARRDSLQQQQLLRQKKRAYKKYDDDDS